MDSSPLLEAINERSEHTPSKCLKAIRDGADVNLTDEEGNNFLHIIADIYNEDIDAPYLIPVVFQLSNAGIERNIKNQKGDTCIHIIAPKSGCQQLLRALIMIGVDPTVKNTEEKDAKALVGNSETNMNMCLELLGPGLWQAAKKGDDDLVMRLIGSWCNTEEMRDGKPLMNLVHINLSDRNATSIEKLSNTMKVVYSALAADKRTLKRALKEENVDVNTKNTTHIGNHGSVFFMPLVGEVALLHNTECLIKLLKKGADVNVIVDETGFNEPLFLYILRLLPPAEEAYDVLEEMFPYADFSLVENKTQTVCKIAFKKRLPFTIVKTMISKGFNLFECDTNGLTLRDRIFLANYSEGPESLRIRLGFVDQAVVDMAIAGDIQTLEKLTLSGYDYSQVVSRAGQTMTEAVAERGNQEVLRFLECLPELQRTIRRVHVAVETGNLLEIKQHMTKRIAESCDKGGRGLLHKAVLFERRYIIKYFLKEYPSMVNMRDSMGRTPVHWAACLKDGKDIEDSLLKAGGDLHAKDKKEKTPEDYRKQMGTMQELLKQERTKDYGIDVYLLQRYIEFKFAIESGNLFRVEEIRSGMYKDVSLNDVHIKMYQTKPPPKDLLSLCIDNNQDKIGKFLLSQGIDWDIKYKDELGNSMNIEKAAEKKEMTQTLEAIQYQKSRAAEEKKILNKVKKEKKELIEKQKKDGTYEAINLGNLDKTVSASLSNDAEKAKKPEESLQPSNAVSKPDQKPTETAPTTTVNTNGVDKSTSNGVKPTDTDTDKKAAGKSCSCVLL